ncbi:MAG: phosphatase PAP2 family protein [Actinomycetota bacterium]|nr:phosphatase PAP2 family protein [Actinomycetota bacterium]
MLALLAFTLALAVALALVGLALGPDRYLFVLLAPALVLRRARRYLLDFVPFALLIAVYAEARGLAHILHPDPYYLPHLEAERLLFGGLVPPVALQEWLWSGALTWFDSLTVDVTRVHSIVPPTLAFALWVTRRALFYRFAATFLTLSFAAAVTFWLYPAAPPWAAAEKGVIDSITRLTKVESGTVSAGGAGTLADPNPYAAIPSLHGGYAFLVFLFVATVLWRTRYRPLVPLAALYPLMQSFAAVYTGNHYVVDLVIGFAYATAALYGVRWLWRRLGWPE